MELAFGGELWFWRGPAPWHFVTVPDQESAAIEAIAPAVTTVPWFQPGGWRYATLNLDSFDDVDELAAAVHAANGHVLIAPTNHREGARMAMVDDPEWNAWELLAEAPAQAPRS